MRETSLFRAAAKDSSMPSPLAATARVALPMLATAVLGGCNGAKDALPEGTYLYYAWDCDGGLHLVMKNLVRDRAISLETREGSRKLPQSVSASGVRYTDGVVTFWTKGDTATYQRDSGSPINCRLAASGDTRP
jgi:membrane-bound inhibitor of C-type lysozyme